MKLKLTKEEKKALKAKRKAEGKGLVAEFKKFITRGNVVDMAVGVIIASSFTKIVNGFTQGIVMPFVNWIVSLCVGDMELSEIVTVLKPVYVIDAETGLATETLDMTKSIIMNWGTLIQAIIDFLLVALVLFTILKVFNYIKDKKEALAEKLKKKEEVAEVAPEPEPEPTPAAPPAPTTNELLTEIIDILKNKE